MSGMRVTPPVRCLSFFLPAWLLPTALHAAFHRLLPLQTIMGRDFPDDELDSLIEDYKV